jgi:hypothetical protein
MCIAKNSAAAVGSPALAGPSTELAVGPDINPPTKAKVSCELLHALPRHAHLFGQFAVT